MKKVIFIFAVLFVCSSALAIKTQAESINYQLECINKTSLRGTDAGILCAGAKSMAPVDCVQWTLSESEVMNTRDRAILCSGATKFKAPVTCFQSVTTIINTRNNAILCSGATSNAPATCANNSLLVNTDSAIACTENGVKWSHYGDADYL